MKLLCTTLFLSLSLFVCCLHAQTIGSGITVTNFNLEGTLLNYSPTTVGTNATEDLLITNEVGVTQEVILSGLTGPFVTSEDTLTIEAGGVAVVTLIFSPESVGDFMATLFFTGSIFGSGEMSIAGEGTQIDIEAAEFLQFENTSIGSSSTATISVSNAGSGSMLISEFVFSDSQYSVVESNLTIPEGETYDLVVTFTPIFAGGSNETMTIVSNDPDEPEYVVDLLAVGISEVSGEICGTWSLVNSPYNLVDNVTVPDDCSLTIEAGVVINGNGFDIVASGPVNCLGTSESRITWNECDLDMDLDGLETTRLEHVDFERIDINSIGQPAPFEYDWNFSSTGAQGWYNSGGIGGSVIWGGSEGDGYIRSEYWSSTSAWRDIYFYAPVRNYAGPLGNLSYRRNIDDYDGGGNGSEYHRLEVNIDGTGWTTLYNENHNGDQPWTEYNFNFDTLASTSTVQFRFHIRFYRGHRFYLDDFSMDVGQEERSEVIIRDMTTEKQFYMTGNYSDVDIDELRTYYSDWNQTDSDYDVRSWTIEGHSEYDEGAYFQGDYNDYHFSHCMLDWDEEDNEQGMDFNNIDYSNYRFDTCSFKGFVYGLYMRNCDYSNYEFYETRADSCTGYGFWMEGIDYSDWTIRGMESRDNSSYGFRLTGSYNTCDLDYSIFADNNNTGFSFESGTNNTYRDSLNVRYCGFFRNASYGLYTTCQSSADYITSVDNTNHGYRFEGAYYNMGQVLSNSILWGNGAGQSWDQVYVQSGNFLNITHSNVMGAEQGFNCSYCDYDQSFISDMPDFTDSEGHLANYSPGVDGGKAWEYDQHMPPGLGGPRADMGMYGGPGNAYWGGAPIADGASSLSAALDIPQDQGNMLGLVFSGSYWDNDTAVDPITAYEIWRHLDPSGTAIGNIDDGNWELVGQVQAQGFNSYGFQAPTLGNTNQFGPFNSCYTVIAQTDFDQLYWSSNVLCGESVDNLAPAQPNVLAEMVESGLVELAWLTPAEADYAYTEITSDHGFTTEVAADTLTFDNTVSEGEDYTYYLTHYDDNGNASDITVVTLGSEVLEDVIALQPGWNLISLDRAPFATSPEALFSDLSMGNLQYVTGFNAGASFYDPNGPAFLNTLNTIEGGRGYWVKVIEEDELRVEGSILPAAYQVDIADGWNLVGYAGQEPVAIADFYSALLGQDQLEYVTAFQGGVLSFNANGPAFLNTLNELENGYGYWVKADLGTGMGLLTDRAVSPAHDFVNGRTHSQLAGETVTVLIDGQAVADIEVLEGGYLMTTPLYGAAEGFDGPEAGAHIEFTWNGRTVDGGTFDGQRILHKVDLDFAVDAVATFPNPATEWTELRFDGVEPMQVLVRDAAGREVARINAANQTGPVRLDVRSWTPGLYSVQVLDKAGSLHTSPLMIGR